MNERCVIATLLLSVSSLISIRCQENHSIRGAVMETKLTTNDTCVQALSRTVKNGDDQNCRL